MKIVGVFLNPEIRTGGHKRYLELMNGLAGKGHEVVLLKHRGLDLSSLGTRNCELSRPAKKPWYSFSLHYVFEILRDRRRVREACGGKADFVVVFGETNFPAALTLKDLLGAEILFAFRTSVYDERRLNPSRNVLKQALTLLFYRLRERFIAKKSAVIVFQSEHDRRGFLGRGNGALAERTHVLGNNINASWFNPEYADCNRSSSLKNLLFLGAFNERKGIMVLLEAFSLLRSRGRGVRLTLAGFGAFEEKVKAYVAEHGLTEAVALPGRTSEPFEALKKADLLVVPSLFDSYPNVVLEALHTGTPVLGSRTGGIQDMLVHEELLFEPGGAEDLAERLAALIDDDGRYREVRGLCAQRKRKFFFDWPGEFEKLMLERVVVDNRKMS